MRSDSIDINDIDALKRRIAELEAAQQVTDTAGGAAVEGSVNAGRDFIGRDFIQIVDKIVVGGDDPDEARSIIAHYLSALASDLAGLKLGEIDVSARDTAREPLQLADVYVPLDTRLQIPVGEPLAEWLSRSPQDDRKDMETPRESRPVSALEALAVHRTLTLLGKPGSGKSTFGASVLLTLAQVWQGHREELKRLGESWTHDAPLPIRVVLRRFAEKLPPGNEPARAGHLWDFIARDLNASGYGLSPRTMEYVQRVARDHGALIVLDGLDECGAEAARRRVMEAVDELQRSAGEKCRFLLTARPYAWPDGPEPRKGIYALADLHDEQIEEFIRAWYGALVKRGWLQPGEANRKMEDLLTARMRPDLLPMARSPLLLTLMATLHANRGRLPDDRADLYDDSVDLLMLRWNQQIGADKALLDALSMPGLKLSDLREVLEELAFNVHKESVVEADRAAVGQGDTADIGEDRLVRAFRPLLNESRDKAAVVVDYIEKRAGLLVGQGEKAGERQFTFPHRTFQEFLAACHLEAMEDFPAECQRLAQAAPGHWQLPLSLAARLAKAERGASAADELVHGASIAEISAQRRPAPTDWACAQLAGMQLLEIGVGAIKKRERTRAIAARVADWIAASLSVHPDDDGLPASQRAAGGDVLAALGDPHFDPDRFYLPNDEMLGFVHIPPDTRFTIGTRRSDVKKVEETIGHEVPDDEVNDTATPTSEFYMGRYPVTVAQFRAFVEAKRFRIGDDDALRDPGSRPVRWVSWHEALAYCDWLNDVISSPVFQETAVGRLVRTGWWRVSLPSELEWEKAARGEMKGGVYSWGDTPDPNRANYVEADIGDTSAVGCFPVNGYGLHDMIGNVWEWTRSLWGAGLDKPDFAYPYDPADASREALDAGGDILRVVRGGSWVNLRDLARCAYRLWSRPDFRSYYLGFRVVLRSAPDK